MRCYAMLTLFNLFTWQNEPDCLAPLPLLELTIADILAYLACSSCLCCDVSLLCRHFMWYHVPFQYGMMNIYIYTQYIHTVLYDIICVSPEWICSTRIVRKVFLFFGWIQYGVFTRHHRNIKVFLEPYHICTSQTVMWTAVDGIQHGHTWPSMFFSPRNVFSTMNASSFSGSSISYQATVHSRERWRMSHRLDMLVFLREALSPQWLGFNLFKFVPFWKKKCLFDVWYADIQRTLRLCMCVCVRKMFLHVSTVNVMAREPCWRPWALCSNPHITK